MSFSSFTWKTWTNEHNVKHKAPDRAAFSLSGSGNVYVCSCTTQTSDLNVTECGWPTRLLYLQFTSISEFHHQPPFYPNFTPRSSGSVREVRLSDFHHRLSEGAHVHPGSWGEVSGFQNFLTNITYAKYSVPLIRWWRQVLNWPMSCWETCYNILSHHHVEGWRDPSRCYVWCCRNS